MKLRRALRVLGLKCLGKPLHLVTDFELVLVVLTATCESKQVGGFEGATSAHRTMGLMGAFRGECGRVMESLTCTDGEN